MYTVEDVWVSSLEQTDFTRLKRCGIWIPRGNDHLGIDEPCSQQHALAVNGVAMLQRIQRKLNERQ